MIPNFPALPAWASGVSGLASRVEPSQLQKNLGWQSNTAPPAAYFNHLLGATYDALAAVKRYSVDYEYVVRDDFVRGVSSIDISAGAAGHTSLWPYWQSKAAIVSVDPTGAACGVVYTQHLNTSDAYLLAAVGPVGPSTDFMFEIRMRGDSASPSHMNFNAGVVSQGSASGTVWFGQTGTTGPVMFTWVPSGRSPTAAAFSASPFSPTAYQSYFVERIGATLYVSVNAQTPTAIGAVLNPFDINAPFGVVGGLSGATGFAKMWIDSAKFGVYRG